MLTFQEMIVHLTQFWGEQGCLVHQGYDLEVGAGTFNPATFLRCLGPEPYSAVYVEPSRRPKDGRYGENPNRVQFYHQMQVIMKPSPDNIQELYLKSLERIGLDLDKHDIRFVHDDWENPTIGAWGLGWEVWADGMEVTQFTYFQAVGGIPVNPVSGEITYGLERLALYIQGVDSFFDLKWNEQITYGDLYQRSEWEWSHYNFTEADVQMWHRHFEDFEEEAKRLVANHLPIPAYDFVMKASHAFNILDARGVISVTERTGYMARIRNLARSLAESYLHSREEQEFPLLRYNKPRKPIELPDLPFKCAPKEKENFLLEVGSEELPATFVPIGMHSLKEQLSHFLKEEDIAFERIEAFGTPRRLAVLVHGLPGGTEPQKMERKGPALNKAFDQRGMLTPAGQGFLRGLGLQDVTRIDIETGKIPSLEIRTLKDCPYLFATVSIPGKSTRKILAKKLPQLILDIDFPKKMRWGDLDIEYARPIRWIVALYGKDVIPFSVGSTMSGHLTYGHRQLNPGAFTVEHPDLYCELLKEAFVVVSVEERQEMILSQISTLEEQLKGKIVAQERVLSQVLYLVEYPYVMAANFDKHFLQAPKEVLISEMVEHQKYFPIEDKDGQLLPHFLITCNNKPSPLIRRGNQKALFPRLADGVFLYEEDLKSTLEAFAEKLKLVTFQNELGSVWDKVQRIQNNCEILHTLLPICDKTLLMRAASLCKADLTSELVGEFPELQGTIGKLYALKQGESEKVAAAIDEHWMPRGEKAPLPQSPCGVLLSLSDKFDNFVSCYSIGLKPTSSSDPYALRRQAIGILKSLLENRHHLSLNIALERIYANFSQTPVLPKEPPSKETILGEIKQFFLARLRGIFVDYGFRKDEIEAVLVHGFDDSYALYLRLKALHDFRVEHGERFAALIEVHTRAKKIVQSVGDVALPGVDEGHLIEESERKLYKRLEAEKRAIVEAGDDYAKILHHLSTLQPVVSEFFDRVKVMAEDEGVRLNRLALLREVWGLCDTLADLTKLQS